MCLDQPAEQLLRPHPSFLPNTPAEQVSRSLIQVVQAVPRLALQLTEKQTRDMEDVGAALPKPLPTLYEVIGSDEEVVLKTMMQITSGVTTIVDKVQTFLSGWEKKYKHMWETDRDGYIRRYEKAMKPLSSFETDIQRYLQLQDEVQGEDTTTTMRFLRIDCGPLKQTLVGHCEAWVSKFTGLLNSLANSELSSLNEYFRSNREQLSVVPSSLDELAEVVNLHKRLVDERVATEARFEPLREKYRALERFEVSVPEDQLASLDALDTEYTKFQVGAGLLCSTGA